MPALLVNNAVSRLAGAITASSTQISLSAGDGAKFPAPTGGNWFPLALIRSSGAIELVVATARNGDVLTVTRGSEGTAPLAFSAGDRVELRLTAGTLNQMFTDNKLSFTPVQQGGGAGMGPDKVYLGWNGVSLTAQVNGSPMGNLWYSSNFDPTAYMPVGGGTFNGRITTAAINANQNANDTSASVEVRSGGGSGDAGLASLAFHCVGITATKLNLRSDGTFGLGGWSLPAWRWYVGPSGDMVAAGNVAAYSDPRLKDDVSRIEQPLDILEQLDGVRFTWNDKSKLIGKTGQRDIGVLADQVEAVLPEIVGRSIEDEDNDGERWRVVDYSKLVPVLIEGIKELHARVKLLEGL